MICTASSATERTAVTALQMPPSYGPGVRAPQCVLGYCLSCLGLLVPVTLPLVSPPGPSSSSTLVHVHTHQPHTETRLYMLATLTQVTHTGYMLAHSTYADLQQPLVHADTRDLARSHVEATRLHEVCVHTRAHTPRAVCTSRTLLTPPSICSFCPLHPPTHP
jgi:hypothetical protein